MIKVSEYRIKNKWLRIMVVNCYFKMIFFVLLFFLIWWVRILSFFIILFCRVFKVLLCLGSVDIFCFFNCFFEVVDVLLFRLMVGLFLDFLCDVFDGVFWCLFCILLVCGRWFFGFILIRVICFLVVLFLFWIIKFCVVIKLWDLL